MSNQAQQPRPDSGSRLAPLDKGSLIISDYGDHYTRAHYSVVHIKQEFLNRVFVHFTATYKDKADVAWLPLPDTREIDPSRYPCPMELLREIVLLWDVWCDIVRRAAQAEQRRQWEVNK